MIRGGFNSCVSLELTRNEACESGPRHRKPSVARAPRPAQFSSSLKATAELAMCRLNAEAHLSYTISLAPGALSRDSGDERLKTMTRTHESEQLVAWGHHTQRTSSKRPSCNVESNSDCFPSQGGVGLTGQMGIRVWTKARTKSRATGIAPSWAIFSAKVSQADGALEFCGATRRSGWPGQPGLMGYLSEVLPKLWRGSEESRRVQMRCSCHVPHPPTSECEHPREPRSINFILWQTSVTAPAGSSFLCETISTHSWSKLKSSPLRRDH